MARPGSRIISCLIIFFALGLIVAGIEAATPTFRAVYHLTPAGAGIIVSSFNLGGVSTLAFLCFPPGARWPPTWVFQVCTVGGCLGMACVRQLDAFIVCSVVGGAGYGGLIARINSFVARTYRSDSTGMLNLVNAAFGAGSVLGPVLDGIGVWYDLAGPAVLIASSVGIRHLGKVRVDTLPASRPAGSRLNGKYSAVLPFAVVAVLYSGLETGLGSWGSCDLIGLGYSARSAAQIMSLFWGGLTVGRLCLPLFKGRIEAAQLLTLCVIVNGLSIFLALTSAAAPAGYALAGFSVGPILPTLVALAAQRVTAVEIITAAIFLSEALGNVVMPLAIGDVVARTSVSCLPFVIAAIACSTFGVSRVTMYWQPKSAR
jgi:MFS transporter, FHS family, glucose/mannose:H+ symporter